jgi:aspartyl-tRNA(Asn)/glutamyl-tRNA(Gln) amidotransferase subunit C
MSDVSEVTLEEVCRVAELANLQLTSEEETRMQRDLCAILGYIAQLNELDTTGVEPMAQVGQMLSERPSVDGETLRADLIQPCTNRVDLMAAAPETDGRFFKVPKVIER